MVCLRTIIWAPWRSSYIKSVSKASKKPKSRCLFCDLKNKDDDDVYILFRGSRNYVVLNAYPYTTGHLMIVPYEHVDTVEKLDDETLIEMMKLMKFMIQVLREEYNPDGFNIGINIGRAAGAGIEDHVHLHIVPRWVGDANFMSTIASTRVLPEALEDTYKKLKNRIRVHMTAKEKVNEINL